MSKFTKRFVTIALASATLVGASLAVGLEAASALTPVAVAFAPSPGVQPPASTVAGVLFATAPAVTVSAEFSAGATVTLSLSGTVPAGAVLTCGGTGTNGDTFTAAATTTFTGCSVNKVGAAYTLTASESPDTGSATSSVFAITPASASQLGFTTQPTSGTAAGAPLTPTVSLEDAFGNVVTTGADIADTVQLTIASGPSATLTCAPKAMATGAVPFSCPINIAGTYTLEATDTTHGTIASGFSLPFTVIPAAEYQLVFITSPALNSTVGLAPATFAVSVAVEDMYGNIITSGTGSGDTVHLAIGTDPAGGTTLACATETGNDAVAANGVATFIDGCSLNKAGTGFTLTATDDTATLIFPVSPAFNVAITSGGAPTSVVTEAAGPITATGAVLNGIVNPGGVAQTCNYLYGTSSILSGASSTGTVFTGSGTTAVSVPVVIGSLTPGITYYFELVCNSVSGGILSFFTIGAPTSAVTEAASLTSTTSATLNGVDNPGGVAQTCHYLYGTSSILSGASSTGSVGTGAGTTAVSEPIAVGSLTPGITYYFELVCTNGDGGILSFNTTGATGSVTTQSATTTTGTTATLNGSVNPGGVAQSCYYLYGTSSILAGAATSTSVVTTASTSAVSVPIVVTTLTSGTVYYYELVCTNGSGGILSFVSGSSSSTPYPIQIYGSDPIGTSIAISGAEFPNAGTAGAVVLARSDFFSDALAGGPLAASVNGPLLLTEGAPISNTLDPRTQAEIQRVLPTGGTVYVLGGDLALSPNIDTTLSGLGYNVIREAGIDEFATAVDIANQLGNPSVVFEATGLSFYDALSAGPAAIVSGAAILLTNGASQAPETATYLAAHPGDTRYAIGGPLAAYGADPSATPIYGQDLFGTSAAVASQFFPNATIFGVATAATFSDALGGGVYMATNGRRGPILLVNPTAPLPTEILPYLATLLPGTQGYVFGGPLAVAASVLSALQAAVG